MLKMTRKIQATNEKREMKRLKAENGISQVQGAHDLCLLRRQAGRLGWPRDRPAEADGVTA